jgi:hypothetical protein
MPEVPGHWEFPCSMSVGADNLNVIKDAVNTLPVTTAKQPNMSICEEMGSLDEKI